MNPQHTPIAYSPYTGVKAPAVLIDAPTAERLRKEKPTIEWDFNPWTGGARLLSDIATDPLGLLIVPPGEAIVAAPGESDPHGRAPNTPGAKLDAGKAPVRRGLLEYFPRACMAVAQISAIGAQKYTWNGWETVPDGAARYGDAEARHICKAAIEGQVDADYGQLHAAHEAWNALARLELILREGAPAPRVAGGAPTAEMIAAGANEYARQSHETHTIDKKAAAVYAAMRELE